MFYFRPAYFFVCVINKLVLNQKDQIQTHRSTRQISWETSPTHTSVVAIIHSDVGVKCLFRLPKRLFPIVASFLTFIFHKVV